MNAESDILLAHVKLLRLQLRRCLPSEIAVVIRRLIAEQADHGYAEDIREYQLLINLLEGWKQ